MTESAPQHGGSVAVASLLWPSVFAEPACPTLMPEPPVLRSASLAGQLRGRAGRPKAMPVQLTALPRMDGLIAAPKLVLDQPAKSTERSLSIRSAMHWFSVPAVYSVVGSVACIVVYRMNVQVSYQGVSYAGEGATCCRRQSKSTARTLAIARPFTGSRCILKGCVQQLMEVPHRPLDGRSIPAAQSIDFGQVLPICWRRMPQTSISQPCMTYKVAFPCLSQARSHKLIDRDSCVWAKHFRHEHQCRIRRRVDDESKAHLPPSYAGLARPRCTASQSVTSSSWTAALASMPCQSRAGGCIWSSFEHQLERLLAYACRTATSLASSQPSSGADNRLTTVPSCP